MGLEFTNEMITDIIGYVQDVFADLMPLILIVVGIGLGIFIFQAVVSSLRNKE
jgi:F0F1-type ATP synthase assembly protein I